MVFVSTVLWNVVVLLIDLVAITDQDKCLTFYARKHWWVIWATCLWQLVGFLSLLAHYAGY